MANPTPFLAFNYQTASPQLVRYLNATPTTVGVTFGSQDGTGTNSTYMNRCSVIRFLGANTFLAITGNIIYRTTDGGASWGSTAGTGGTINAFGSFQSNHTGFRVIFDSTGAPWVALIYSRSGGGYSAIYSSDGINWSGYDAPDLGSSLNVPFCDSVVFGGQLLTLQFLTDTTLLTIAFDADTKTISYSTDAYALSGFNNGVYMSALCVYNNIVHALVFLSNGSAFKWDLIVWTGTSWNTVVANVGNETQPGQPVSDMKPALFTDGDFLYAMTMNAAFPLWKLSQFDTSYNYTSLNSLLPSPFQSGGASSSARTAVYIDGETTPGSAPNVFIYFANNGVTSTSWNLYQFSNTTLWTLIEVGGSAGHALALSKEVQGDYSWTSGGDSVEIVSATGIQGGVRFGFKLFSTSGSDSVGVKAWQNIQANAYPTAPATLANPSVGVLSGPSAGNSISGLTADNSTVYFVTWSATTDGFLPGQRPKFVMELF